MPRYGVKLNSGKVLWVKADNAEVRDGAIIFFGQPEPSNPQRRGVVAAFPLASVDHFGLPEVLESNQSATAASSSQNALASASTSSGVPTSVVPIKA
jgi:hypothetical protein